MPGLLWRLGPSMCGSDFWLAGQRRISGIHKVLIQNRRWPSGELGHVGLHRIRALARTTRNGPVQASAVRHASDSASVVLTHVRAGQLRDEEPLPQVQSAADLALLVPLFASRGALLVICENDSAPAARSTRQSLVLPTTLDMPSEVRLTLPDPIGLAAAFPFRSSLSRIRPTGNLH